MARTKKNEEMEQNLTAVEETNVTVSENEAPVLLEDAVSEELLADAEEDFQLAEEAALPEMDLSSELPADFEQSPDGIEPLQEEPAPIPEASMEEKEATTGHSESEPEKVKRTVRQKRAETASNGENLEEAIEGKDAVTSAEKTGKRTARKRAATPSVLTIESRAEVETPDDREEMVWHEIHNAYRTRKILTGTLGGIEQTENGKTIAIVYYKEMRIVIPMKEMMIKLSQENAADYGEMMLRQSKILGTMLGAEIDFVVKGIDSKTRSVVASRRDAMLKKRQLFYMETDASGMYRIYENRIVQARVIAVADKVLRVEIFGVECSILARDLSWDWLGDAHERFSVGDEILVRILSVKRDLVEDIVVKADVKSVTSNTGRENLSKCRVQGKYAGKVTDIHKGVVFIRLSIGVNAIAHSCYDNRMPGKKDDVSFAVTHIDEERGVAVGIITRIIKQNL
ncbi:S1 RNA-binding domain-containing protein [Anaerocolumna xylanovorans]|uniref:S1 RNA binding domain-containing protein n=1 Tax=Anaerocolumna xylanovorans DSM 12503 TaxID=1121345 RepID=A0A1M7Y0S2_9FIRM|nr:S1 RNA-binding domain-containing protein [Anaerocolumna xylanovorans]SHO45231.1 S1 RNA binding domain-containing protein [Anaerocolumna xylanovorans DSM 12503]